MLPPCPLLPPLRPLPAPLLPPLLLPPLCLLPLCACALLPGLGSFLALPVGLLSSCSHGRGVAAAWRRVADCPASVMPRMASGTGGTPGVLLTGRDAGALGAVCGVGWCAVVVVVGGLLVAGSPAGWLLLGAGGGLALCCAAPSTTRRVPSPARTWVMPLPLLLPPPIVGTVPYLGCAAAAAPGWVRTNGLAGFATLLSPGVGRSWAAAALRAWVGR